MTLSQEDFIKHLSQIYDIISSNEVFEVKLDNILNIFSSIIKCESVNVYRTLYNDNDDKTVFKHLHSWSTDNSKTLDSFAELLSQEVLTRLLNEINYSERSADNKYIHINRNTHTEIFDNILPFFHTDNVYICPVNDEYSNWGNIIFDSNINVLDSEMLTHCISVVVGLLSNFITNHYSYISLKSSKDRILKALEVSGIAIWDINVAKNTIYLSTLLKKYLAHTDTREIVPFEDFMGEVSYFNVEAVKDFFVRCNNSNGKLEQLEYERDVASIRRTIVTKGTSMINEDDGLKHLVGIFYDNTSERKLNEELRAALSSAEVANQAKSTFLATMSHEIRTPLNGMLGFLALMNEYVKDNTGKEYLKIINTSAESLIEIINSILDFAKIESDKILLEYRNVDLVQDIEGLIRLFIAAAKEKGVYLYASIDANIPSKVKCDQLRIKQVLTNLLSNAIKFTNSGGSVYFRANVIDIYDGTVQILFSVTDTGIGISKDNMKYIFKPFTQADSSVSRRFGGSGLGLAIAHKLVQLMGGDLDVDSEQNVGTKFYFPLEFTYTQEQDEVFNRKNRVTIACLFDNEVAANEIADTYKIIGVKSNFYKTYQHFISDNVGETHLQIYDLFFNEDKIADIESVRNQFPDLVISLLSYPIRTEIGEKLRQLDTIVGFYPLSNGKLYKLLEGKTKTAEALPNTDKIKNKKYNGKVLIAEDNDINSKLIEIMLSNFSIELDIVTNGRLAVEKFKTEKYDLVLMDINMPEQDGISATKDIRRYEQAYGLSYTPIVALTANVMKEDSELILHAGMDYILIKPIVEQKLHEVLSKYLRRIT